MSDLHPVFVRAKEILLTQGWYGGAARGPKGEPCIIIACCYAYDEVYSDDVVNSGNIINIHEVLEEIAGVKDVPRWNDDPTRTLEEVIDVLDKAILLTVPVVEYAGSC